MDQEEFIAIPHFINPHLFWYHKVDGQNPAFLEFQEIEESLQTLFTPKQSAALRPHRPLVGEIVAIAFVSWNKYIRARVEDIAKVMRGDDEYVVWALDYGFPFQTKLCYVRKLPDSHKQLTDHIRVGAIANVIPAELDFNYVTITSHLECKDSWPNQAVDLLEKVINDAASISFIESFSSEDVSRKQHFGDLKIINHSGDEFFVSDYLIKLNFAVKCVDNFRARLATLKTTKIPCWQTNSRDTKIIDNKLNTSNMHYLHQGKFALSPSLFESSHDAYSKQKVIDWCERNQNFNEHNEVDAEACPTFALDATDISFDDSVSVGNFKAVGRRVSTDETVMGYAGAIHERRKKYEGKGLPPKPALDVFEVIPEKKKPLEEEKKDTLSKSGDSAGSGLSQRAKALIELRKKLQEKENDRKAENIPNEQVANVGSPSETGTEEFLEACKVKNAQSARLERLKELRKRRVMEVTPSNEDASINEVIERIENISTTTESVEDNSNNSISSSRLLLLKRIKEKYSKRNQMREEHKYVAPDEKISDSNTDIENQSESRISSHAAKLISIRKKIKEKYAQQYQTEISSFDKNVSDEYVAPPVHSQKQGYKMPQQSSKFNKLDFSKSSQEYVEKPLPKPQDISPALSKDMSPKSDVSSRTSTARENELRNLRKMIHEKPFQNMTMVPAGFDVTKLVKRNNEDKHWHTKKTTLTDSLQSNYFAEDQQSSLSPFNSSHKQPIPRRTEEVEEQNFRLTWPRKERKKDYLIKLNEKHLLDMSLNDFGCAPAIEPVVVSDKTPKDTKDLLVFNDSDKEDRQSEGGQIITNLCANKSEKLIDLSGKSETLNVSNLSANTSSDSFLKFMREKSSVRDTSREKLLETSNVTSEGSVDLLPVEEAEACCKDSSSSISSRSFTKLETTTTEICSDVLKKEASRSYEASSSSSSASSASIGKTVGRAPIMPPSHIKKPIMMSSSSNSSERQSPIATMQNKPPSRMVKKPINTTTEVDKLENDFADKFRPPSPLSSSLIKLAVSDTIHNKALSEGSVRKPESSSSIASTQTGKFSSNLPGAPQFPTVAISTQSTVTFESSVVKSHSSSLPSSSLVKSYRPLKPTTLTLSGSDPSVTIATHHLPEVAGEASIKTNLIQHLVLAHSNVKVTPIERMTSALFSPEIHHEMENMRLTKMYRIQSYAWAHLVRGNSFFVINASRTGKTWCYLPPICSMVGFRLETKSLPQTYGPVAVIIVPSSVQVESIARQCRRLLASTKTMVTIVPSYAFRNAEEVKIELHNGCGILVVTPPSLRRLLVANERESLLNMERIQHVVVDDLDTLLGQDGEFSETFQKFIAPVSHRNENGKVPFQIVVTSKRWSQRMINLLRISNQPLLCVADYFEAAVYGKAKVSIKLQSSTEKMKVMLKSLEKCPYALEKVIVICSLDDEVTEVEKLLLEAGYACLAYTGHVSVEYANLVNEWKNNTICHKVLVTTDSVLPELMVQNAWVIVHYSLPTSWTKFSFRFSTFFENYKNLLKTNFVKPDKVPKSIILLDENNNLQLPRLIEFMKHHDQLKHVHPDILNVAASVTAEREELRVAQGILMCPKILEFGSCDQSSRCAFRHQLTKYDGPVEGIPKNGEVRLKILDVLSPTHYVARLLTHKEQTTWEIIKRSNEVTQFLMQLTFHFMNEDAQVIHWPLRVNDLCVYKGEGVFHRCRLLEVPQIVYENIVKLVNVKVKLIDSGSSLMCKSHDIFVIPEKFKDFPAQAVDIRLSGVIPFDNERAWDSRSTRTVKNWIITDVTDKDCLQASINFTLMDTIWVNNVILMEKLTTIRGYAVKINVRRSLLGKGFALPDDQMHSVKQTAIEHGLLKVSPEVSKEESVEKSECEQNLLEFSSSTVSGEMDLSHNDQLKQATPVSVKKSAPVSAKKESSSKVIHKTNEEWMQLGIDELVQVKIAQIHDPSNLYLRLLSKEDDLKELEDVIRNQKKFPLEDPHPVQNCLAPHDGRYYRAKIQRLIVDSSEGCVQARVFFCDLGIFSNYPLEQLRSSSKEITEHIPFQAICCKLTGIQMECLGEEINEVIQFENSAHLAYVVTEISDAYDCNEAFYIRSYEIILYECLTDKKDIQINKLLVEQGLARYDEETKHFLELESIADIGNYDYNQGEVENFYDFQEFLNRIQQQMEEEDGEEEAMNYSNSPYKAIEDREPKIVEITADSPADLKEIPAPKTESLLPTLRTLHKRPLTTWYETMCMIYLVIHAPDISDYHLEVTPKRMIFVAVVNGEENMLILDLLGYVEPDKVTHEIRGLNVVVRLVKSVYMEWPRLLEDPTKFSWLTYNFNAIDTMEAEKLIDGRHSRPKRRMNSYSSEGDSDTSNSNACETFTPIVNIDELHDPIGEFC